MKKKIGVILLAGLAISSCAYLPGYSNSQAEVGYEMINVDELQEMMEEEDFTFVNVHIPVEGNIPDTDVEIPFDDMESYLDQLPMEKDAKIVLYCRSGSMSRIASETLVDLGYTNVFDLDGGYNAWVADGLPFEE
jgi:rhodanese-related sulfurtransferase